MDFVSALTDWTRLLYGTTSVNKLFRLEQREVFFPLGRLRVSSHGHAIPLGVVERQRAEI